MSYEKQQIEELSNQVEQVEKKVDRLVDAVIGNEYNPNGFKQRIERLEAQARKELIFRMKIIWMWAGAGAAVSFLSWILFYVIPHFAK